jgi:peroxiredoxin
MAQNEKREEDLFRSPESDSLIGKKFPAFKVKLPDGSMLTSKDLRNKVVFINFWFAACSPCMAEMEGLNKLYDTLKGHKDFLFLSFSFDPKETTNKIIEKRRIKYRVTNISRDECKRLNRVDHYPTSFILDKKGVIKWAVARGTDDEEIASGSVILLTYPKILSEL